MYIVDVIPISSGMKKETLSYFTAKEVSPGDLVLVPLRSKKIPALVVESRSARDAKTSLRQSAYGMRKISEVKTEHFFLTPFISAAEKTAKYFASGTGAVIETLVPKAVLLGAIAGTVSLPKREKQKEGKKIHGHFEAYAFQTSLKDRLAAYKGLVREEFAKNHSVLLLTPIADDISYIISSLNKGIEEHIYALHGGLTQKKLLEVWQRAAKDTHPVLIVGGSASLSVPREDIGTIIVEKENSWTYKKEHRPFVDVRTFALHFAEALKARVIFAATVLSVETLHKRESGDISDFVPPIFHILSPADTAIIDMRGTHSPLQLTPETFTVISDELKTSIEEVRRENQHIFLYAARRGLYPMTICGDCGTVVLCSRCAAPLVLHKEAREKKAAERVFLCHKCNELNVVTDRCAHCNSWRLAPLGVGTERVEEEVRRLFPTIKITRVDKDKTKTRKSVEKAIAAFLDSPGSVLVGTEVALSALKKKIAVTSAVSIDPLLALPSFRISERAFHILISLREKANKKCIIQTRMPALPLFQYVRHGNITEFYKEEISSRRALRYPPCTTLIKLTTSGTKERIEKEATLIKKHLHGYDMLMFPAFISKVRGKYVMHAVLKLKQGEWPDEKIHKLLGELPPSIAVNVEPEHLL